MPVHRYSLSHDGRYRSEVPQRSDRACNACTHREYQTSVILCQTLANRRKHRTRHKDSHVFHVWGRLQFRAAPRSPTQPPVLLCHLRQVSHHHLGNVPGWIQEEGGGDNPVLPRGESGSGWTLPWLHSCLLNKTKGSTHNTQVSHSHTPLYIPMVNSVKSNDWRQRVCKLNLGRGSHGDGKSWNLKLSLRVKEKPWIFCHFSRSHGKLIFQGSHGKVTEFCTNHVCSLHNIWQSSSLHLQVCFFLSHSLVHILCLPGPVYDWPFYIDLQEFFVQFAPGARQVVSCHRERWCQCLLFERAFAGTPDGGKRTGWPTRSQLHDHMHELPTTEWVQQAASVW